MTTSWLPSPAQTLLLRASLLDDRAAEEAWEDFQEIADLDTVDAGSHRLLPLLFRRLSAAGLDSPEMNRLRGIHRRSWYANLLLRTTTERMLAKLQSEGVPTLLMKGAGLHTTIYRDEPAIRPLDDLDVLVPLGQAATAGRLLVDAGYLPKPAQIYRPDRWAYHGHSIPFEGGPAEAIDLHVRPLRYQFDRSYTDAVWARRVEVLFGSTPTSTLDPTDHLLITVLHGASPNSIPPCRWAADATFLIRGGEIDWGRFVDDVIALGRARAAAEALGFLREHLDVTLDPTIVERLAAARCGPLARSLERQERRPLTGARLVIRAVLPEYLFSTAGAPIGQRVRGYPHYLRLRTFRGVPRTVQAMGAVLRHGPTVAR